MHGVHTRDDDCLELVIQSGTGGGGGGGGNACSYIGTQPDESNSSSSRERDYLDTRREPDERKRPRRANRALNARSGGSDAFWIEYPFVSTNKMMAIVFLAIAIYIMLVPPPALWTCSSVTMSDDSRAGPDHLRQHQRPGSDQSSDATSPCMPWGGTKGERGVPIDVLRCMAFVVAGGAMIFLWCVKFESLFGALMALCGYGLWVILLLPKGWYAGNFTFATTWTLLLCFYIIIGIYSETLPFIFFFDPTTAADNNPRRRPTQSRTRAD
jgi:hypothetical protein